jgi:hypothetical protein
LAFLAVLVARVGTAPTRWLAAEVVSISYAVATISHFTIERRFVRMKRRFGQAAMMSAAGAKKSLRTKAEAQSAG